jgi:UDP-N-acetylmuramate dehydrogenase
MRTGRKSTTSPFRISPNGLLLRGEPLAPLTSFGIGGPAELLLLPAEIDDFRESIAFAAANGMAWRILGSGTNVLVPDEGLPGLTIKPWRRFSQIRFEGARMVIQAGATMWEAARRAAKEGLSGLEWACGIPGTVGGAVYMNAGVKEAEIKDVLASALVLERDSGIRERGPGELGFAYRSSALQTGGGVLLEAAFGLKPEDQEVIYAAMNRYLEQRRRSQPLEQPNCGSVFRNPPGDFAGRLIEAAGCKGLRRGGMKVSELHANFIVNLGGGRAREVLALVEEIGRRVYDDSGVRLELEMRVLE